MNTAIKTLEEIGQNASIQQYGNIEDMLNNLEIQKFSLDSIMNEEYICALFPEDDEEE